MNVFNIDYPTQIAWEIWLIFIVNYNHHRLRRSKFFLGLGQKFKVASSHSILHCVKMIRKSVLSSVKILIRLQKIHLKVWIWDIKNRSRVKIVNHRSAYMRIGFVRSYVNIEEKDKSNQFDLPENRSRVNSSKYLSGLTRLVRVRTYYARLC